MWYETDITPRGRRRLRYSVVFSHEDGGTPADRLMATWGRLTDIEFVLGVEVSPEGRVLGAEIQGKDHRIVPFTYPAKGPPHLFVVTDNNMLAPQGTTDPVYAPVPVLFPLHGTSREAVMDAFPWTYAVSSREAIRQGHVSHEARPGSRKVPDPRRFLYVEACAETKDATLAFSVGVGRGEPLVWADSDEGGPSFRIQRRADQFPNGCFRGAVALADGLPSGRHPGCVSGPSRAPWAKGSLRCPGAGRAPSFAA